MNKIPICDISPALSPLKHFVSLGKCWYVRSKAADKWLLISLHNARKSVSFSSWNKWLYDIQNLNTFIWHVYFWYSCVTGFWSNCNFMICLQDIQIKHKAELAFFFFFFFFLIHFISRYIQKTACIIWSTSQHNCYQYQYGPGHT